MIGVDLEALPTGDRAPAVVNAVIEIPVGSRNKYEYDPELGVIARDRVLPGNIRFPADYGFIPSTLGNDGEAMDILVAAYEGVFPGCVLQARVIGALEIVDHNGREYNVYALPDNDPRFDSISALGDLPRQSLQELEDFFTVYKRLEGDKQAEVVGWRDIEETLEIVRRGMEGFGG